MVRKQKRINRARVHRKSYTVMLIVILAVVIGALYCAVLFFLDNHLTGSIIPYSLSDEISLSSTDSGSLRAASFASNLCVGEDNTELKNISLEDTQTGGLFNLDQKSIVYSSGLYKRIYPASMTKIMTALIALEEGNMDDIVEISSSAVELEAGSQVCGFSPGDKVPMRDLIACLLVYSGNDAASAIAETIGGSQEEFVTLMNEKAISLGMTGTHFTNPHGLHDDDHYTTVYDIYIMSNEVMKNPTFLEYSQMSQFSLEWEGGDETTKERTYTATDLYLTGEATAPRGVTILGGKTGTTIMAGSCLTLMTQNSYGQPFISVITNAPTGEALYTQMNQLLNQINS